MTTCILPVVVDAVADRVARGPMDRKHERRDASAALGERGYKAYAW
jgi:hypothetical protein